MTGNIQPTTIKEIQTFPKCLDKHNCTELRDHTIVLLMLDTGIRTSEIMGLKNSDYDMDGQCIMIRADVAINRKGSQYLTVLAAF